MGRTVGGLAALALGVLLGGCSNLEVELGDPVDVELCRTLAVGSTRAEVLAALGPPTDVATFEGGAALIYEHVVLDEAQLGLDLSQVGILLGVPELGWLKLSFGESDSVRETVVLVFDPEGRLMVRAAHTWGEDFGTGAGLQFLFLVDEVTDRGNLAEEHDALQWGRELFETPQEMLNREHRAALELRGHPTRAGQRTLELPLPEDV